MNIVTIPVYMSEEETRLFIGFQKHHKLFEVLEREGALGLPNSSFEVHFDSEGKVRVIDLHKTIR